MKNSIKPPSSSKKHLIILIILGVFISISPVLESKTQSLIIPSFEEMSESLVTIEKNSLLPISSLFISNTDNTTIKVIITAYSSSPWQTDSTPFITAAGTEVRDGIIANNLLAFGTKVKIPELYGNKIFVVEDRMHSRKSDYHFDIWFPSYGEALNFGAKTTYIEILES